MVVCDGGGDGGLQISLGGIGSWTNEELRLIPARVACQQDMQTQRPTSNPIDLPLFRWLLVHLLHLSAYVTCHGHMSCGQRSVILHPSISSQQWASVDGKLFGCLSKSPQRAEDECIILSRWNWNIAHNYWNSKEGMFVMYKWIPWNLFYWTANLPGQSGAPFNVLHVSIGTILHTFHSP